MAVQVVVAPVVDIADLLLLLLVLLLYLQKLREVGIADRYYKCFLSRFVRFLQCMCC